MVMDNMQFILSVFVIVAIIVCILWGSLVVSILILSLFLDKNQKLDKITNNPFDEIDFNEGGGL
jgi:hypothetical protein